MHINTSPIRTLAVALTGFVLLLTTACGSPESGGGAASLSCAEVPSVAQLGAGGEADGFDAVIIDISPSTLQAGIRDEQIEMATAAVYAAGQAEHHLFEIQATADSVRTARTLFDGSLAGEGTNGLLRGQDRDKRVVVASCALDDAFENESAEIRRSDLLGALWLTAQHEARTAVPDGPCHILLASDGAHNGEGIDLADPGAVAQIEAAGLLPDLGGCSLEVTHIGRGGPRADPERGRALIAGWESYADATGAELAPAR